MTELLLKGLARCPGDFHWILWGPLRIRELAWQGAEIALCSRDPRQWNGQRSWFEIPASDLAMFLHQQRPLRRLPSVTFIHDTIPLHFARNRTERELKRLFLRRVVRGSRRVLTPSQHSMRSIVSELRVAPEAVRVVRLPADAEMARRVAALRRSLAPEPVALYLGLFLPHKNLDLLVEAFGRTAFRREGGRLLLIGGIATQTEEFVTRLPAEARDYVEVRPFAGQPEVEAALGFCRFLVLPSLEEGFGLPAWEALSAGVPVCASDGGAVPEIAAGRAELFSAYSLDEMVVALDRCAARAASRTPADGEAASNEFLAEAPSIEEFAAEVVAILEDALRVGSPERSA